MKNSFKFFGIIAIFAVIGLSMTSCQQEPVPAPPIVQPPPPPDPGPQQPANPFIGTWRHMGVHSWGTETLTLTITGTGWHLLVQTMEFGWGEDSWSDSGTYSSTGNTAIFSGGRYLSGTATISGATLTVFFDGHPVNFTRQ